MLIDQRALSKHPYDARLMPTVPPAYLPAPTPALRQTWREAAPPYRDHVTTIPAPRVFAPSTNSRPLPQPSAAPALVGVPTGFPQPLPGPVAAAPVQVPATAVAPTVVQHGTRRGSVPLALTLVSLGLSGALLLAFLLQPAFVTASVAGLPVLVVASGVAAVMGLVAFVTDLVAKSAGKALLVMIGWGALAVMVAIFYGSALLARVTLG